MCENIKSLKWLLEEADEVFQNKFGNKATSKSFGPGRVNIIGEHTDYNEGYVLPMALPMGTVMLGCINNLTECRIFTMSSDVKCMDIVTFPIPKDGEIIKSTIPWANYVIGVVAYFKCKNKKCFDAVINSSVPLGSGLSSSASLEVACYVFLEGLWENSEKLEYSEKALLCQKAEHNYAGVPCGIMDQFIGIMGKKDHALFIDCRNLSSQLIKFKDDSVSILIINSNIKHNLGSSEYPLRRNDCYLAAKIFDKTSLREMSIKELEAEAEKLDSRIYMRARHVITENKRVLDSIEALNHSDFYRLGKYMNESHDSLRYDFEVSCNEIDQLVEIVQSCNGVFGSRMTGGGFGGCTVSLVCNTEINSIIKEVKTKFIGNPVFYICTPQDGARLIN